MLFLRRPSHATPLPTTFFSRASLLLRTFLLRNRTARARRVWIASTYLTSPTWRRPSYLVAAQCRRAFTAATVVTAGAFCPRCRHERLAQRITTTLPAVCIFRCVGGTRFRIPGGYVTHPAEFR